MPFTIRPYRRFPVPCAVTYNARPFQCQGTVWSLSCTPLCENRLCYGAGPHRRHHLLRRYFGVCVWSQRACCSQAL